MEIIRKSIEVQGVIVHYQTVIIHKNNPQAEELISQGYWKSVQAGDWLTFIKLLISKIN